MKVAVIDADLIGRKKHRFPNLASMKISGYHKDCGDCVQLKTDYDSLNEFDKVYISKVFTDTPIDENILKLPNVKYGGTGFYFDQAPDLPYEIEHHMPDYYLYDDWIEEQISNGVPKNQFKEYRDNSIGFLTRGCFRKCGFCVNKKYDHVFLHSKLSEFYDDSRKKICMLDDNVLGSPEWRNILSELIETNKPFKFKQGMDERLLTDEKCEILFNAKYDGDYIFAFDNISDYDLIHKKLQMIRIQINLVNLSDSKNLRQICRIHTDKTNIKFYVLVGYENTDVIDIKNAFKRIELLMRYHCLPYIMRFQNKNNSPWKDSDMRGMYITLARWCNQPSFFKKKSIREYANMNTNNAAKRYITEFEEKYPDIADKYFDMKWENYTDLLKKEEDK